MTPSERRRKTTALSLLACMAAVAAAVWYWPSAGSRPHRVVRADVVLPAPPVHVSAVTSTRHLRATVPSVPAYVRPSRAIDRQTSARSMPAVEERPMPVASHALVVPMRPVLADPQRPPSRAETPGSAFAHAGVALGDAFRRAGVKTGAAFTRIF